WARRTKGVVGLRRPLRHEPPGVADTAKRLGVKSGQSVGYVLKTINPSHGGKMSVVRVLAGKNGDGANITTADGQTGRVAAVFKPIGPNKRKRGRGEAGQSVPR